MAMIPISRPYRTRNTSGCCLLPVSRPLAGLPLHKKMEPIPLIWSTRIGTRPYLRLNRPAGIRGIVLPLRRFSSSISILLSYNFCFLQPQLHTNSRFQLIVFPLPPQKQKGTSSTYPRTPCPFSRANAFFRLKILFYSFTTGTVCTCPLRSTFNQ